VLSVVFSLYTGAASRASRELQNDKINKAMPGNRPDQAFREEPDPKERLRVGSRIVQGLYDDAVK